MKRFVILLFLLSILISAGIILARDPDEMEPLLRYTKAVPAYPIRHICQACVHPGATDWFELGAHNGHVYLEVFGGAQITGVYDGNFTKLPVRITNHLGFFYEGTRRAYITGIPTDLDRVLIGLGLPGFGDADFGAR